MYQILYSSGYEPDLSEVNRQANKFDLIQMGQSTNSASEKQWWYLMKEKEAEAPPPGR